MNERLSPRQRDFTRAVAALAKQRGIPPTLRELAAELGVSVPRVATLADACESRGAVTRERRVARSIRVAQPGKRTRKRASGGNR